MKLFPVNGRVGGKRKNTVVKVANKSANTFATTPSLPRWNGPGVRRFLPRKSSSAIGII